MDSVQNGVSIPASNNNPFLISSETIPKVINIRDMGISVACDNSIYHHIKKAL